MHSKYTLEGSTAVDAPYVLAGSQPKTGIRVYLQQPWMKTRVQREHDMLTSSSIDMLLFSGKYTHAGSIPYTQKGIITHKCFPAVCNVRLLTFKRLSLKYRKREVPVIFEADTIQICFHTRELAICSERSGFHCAFDSFLVLVPKKLSPQYHVNQQTQPWCITSMGV